MRSFDINWGDGTTDSNVTDTTLKSHIHIKRRFSYTVQVTARNTGGTGSGSSASLTRSNFITIFLAGFGSLITFMMHHQVVV